MIDWFQLDDGFALVEAAAPVSMIGKTLEQLKVRSRFGITVVSIKPMGAPFTYATADTVIGEGDILLVAANTDAAERFTRQKYRKPWSNQHQARTNCLRCARTGSGRWRWSPTPTTWSTAPPLRLLAGRLPVRRWPTCWSPEARRVSPHYLQVNVARCARRNSIAVALLSA